MKLMYTATALGATVATPNFNMPNADSYAFILDVGTPGGTTETLDVALQATPDNGTTWYDWARFAQVTTAAITRRLIVQDMEGRGEVGTEGVVTSGTANSVLAQNMPMSVGINGLMRFNLTISGTLPTYATVKIWMVCLPQDSANTSA